MAVKLSAVLLTTDNRQPTTDNHFPVIDSSIPQTVVQGVLAPLGVVSARPTPPGMSGARVFQCQFASGDSLALKRWPGGTTRSRIAEVHKVIQRSKNHGCLIVPTLQVISRPVDREHRTLFTYQQHHWDLMQWMPGRAATADAAVDQVRRGAATIARFHTSLLGLGVQSQPPPAVLARLRRLNELDGVIPKTLGMTGKRELAHELAGAIHDACILVQSKWGEVRTRIARSLSQYATRNVPTHYVLRDIHRDHVLFTDQEPTGLIDFDAIRVDTPTTDLARWVGSFLDGRTETETLWNAALAGFREEYSFHRRPESAIDGHLAKELNFATTWISLVNWMDWTLCQQRSFPSGPKVVANRVRELIRLADQVS